MSCLDDNTIAALVEGLLAKDDLARIDAHIDGCAACRQLLSNVAPLLEPAPSRAPRPPSSPSFTISETVELDQIKWKATMRVGTTLRDKWRLERLLGVGGTAAVYEATHKNNGSRVAIKIIHKSFPRDSHERRRFLREGYAANAVGHPGIAHVIDDDVDESGAMFLVSEFVDGETLHARLIRTGPLGVAAVLAIADDVLDILAAAHEKGIIHRDIKPENILACATGGMRLLDFGIASVREGTFESTLTTATGFTLGTPAFMSPEQARGDAAKMGPASDLWSLGATMFTLLSGKLVHDCRTVTDLLVRAGRSPAPPLASVVAGTPPDVAALIDQALAFLPGDRWSSAREMQAATRRVLTSLSSVRPPPAPVTPVLSAPSVDLPEKVTQVMARPVFSPAPASPPSTAIETSSRLRAPLVVVGVAAVVFVLGMRLRHPAPPDVLPTASADTADLPVAVSTATETGSPIAPPIESVARPVVNAPPESRGAARATKARTVAPSPGGSAVRTTAIASPTAPSSSSSSSASSSWLDRRTR
jgi:serine/threonine-protein kinase